jgi:hypothetical protein
MRTHTRFTAAIVVMLLLVVACSAVVAAEAPAAPKAKEQGLWTKLFSSTFGLILIFIFVPVLVTTFIAARQRDRCLKTFDKFHASIVTKKKKHIWGVLRVYSKGLVCHYRDTVESDTAPPKVSYFMYEAEMPDVFAIFRFHDRISEKNKSRRARQIRALAYPNIFRRLWRRVRNLINTLRDAFNKAISAFLGQMQKAKPGSKMLKTGGKQMEGVGTQLLGKVANAYEPLLEQSIGSPVVIEVTGPPEGDKPGPKKEYAGQMAEYSAGYVMVLDVLDDFETTAAAGGPQAFDGLVTVRAGDDKIEITNGLEVTLSATSVAYAGKTHLIDATVGSGETSALPLRLSEITPPPPETADNGEAAPPPEPPGPPVVKLVARRQADIMVPRTHVVVRHGGVRREDDE